jgi:hypothetical protein
MRKAAVAHGPMPMPEYAPAAAPMADGMVYEEDIAEEDSAEDDV